MALRDLRNLGPASEAMLKEAGIENELQLRAKGAAEAYNRVRFIYGQKATKHLLWALEGALTDRDWRRIPTERKQTLFQTLNLKF